ncbi:MAG: energy transducer TonB [Campylobacterales bacterium]
MPRYGLKAFWIALALYLPLLLTMLHLQKEWAVTPKKQNDERLIPLGSILQPPRPAIVATEQKPSAQTRPPSPPAAATAQEPAPIEPEEHEGRTAPAQVLTPEELSAAFAPVAPPPADTPIEKTDSLIPATELGDLYGVMLLELTEEERRFLENQLGPIGVITQGYLRYPALAGQLRMSGETVVAFTLLPDGDITPIEIIKSSGYSLLDDNAVHTVQIAHKDYPRPKEPVRVRMRVIYRLF